MKASPSGPRSLCRTSSAALASTFARSASSVVDVHQIELVDLQALEAAFENLHRLVAGARLDLGRDEEALAAILDGSLKRLQIDSSIWCTSGTDEADLAKVEEGGCSASPQAARPSVDALHHHQPYRSHRTRQRAISIALECAQHRAKMERRHGHEPGHEAGLQTIALPVAKRKLGVITVNLRLGLISECSKADGSSLSLPVTPSLNVAKTRRNKGLAQLLEDKEILDRPQQPRSTW